MSDASAAQLASLPRSPGRRIIRREDAQNWIDGYRFVEEARQVADSIVQSAQTAYEEAKRRGFEEGRRAGEEQAVAIATQTVVDADRYLASIDGQVAELTMSIIERVLGQVPVSELVVQATKEALRSFRGEKYLKVRVAPQVHEKAQQALSHWAEANGLGACVLVEADTQLTSRQCRIVTEAGVVDVSLDAQLSVIRRALTATARTAEES